MPPNKRSGSVSIHANKLKCNVLPTNWDVIAHFHYIRDKIMVEDPSFVNNKFPSFNQLKLGVIKDIKAVWASSSLPYVSDKRIEDRLKSILQKFKKAKFKASKKGTKVNGTDDIFPNLFDICTCKSDLSKISTTARVEKNSWKCPRVFCQGKFLIF